MGRRKGLSLISFTKDILPPQIYGNYATHGCIVVEEERNDWRTNRSQMALVRKENITVNQ